MVTAPVATEFSRFAALRAEARGGEGTAYKAVAREFEAVFLNLLLKSARETTFQTDFFGYGQAQLDVPPGSSGNDRFFQAWYRDPVASPCAKSSSCFFFLLRQ
jgi:Rod binding domain-containing protein